MRSAIPDIKNAPTRVIHGVVSPSGGIISGTGFKVTKGGTGLFTVTFVKPFKTTPHGGAVIGSNGAQIAGVTPNDEKSMAVNCFAANGTGALADPVVQFTFWAWEVDPNA